MRKENLWRNFFYVCLMTCLFFVCCQTPVFESFISRGDYEGDYWPTAGWKNCSPEEVGVNSERLYQAYEYAAQTQYSTYAILIIKDGYIIGEEYLRGNSQSSLFHSYSISKSFLSGLIGIAIDEGLIGDLNGFAYHYFPQWQVAGADSRKKKITIRHLLGMGTGIEWNEDYSDPENDINQMIASGDYLSYMLNKPMESEPWYYWEYNSGNSVLLSGILQKVTGLPAYEYGLQKVFNTIGIPGIIWESDSTGLTIGAWGIRSTARDYAKFGYLYLKNGEWEGRQLIPSQWVSLSTEPITNNITSYALHWWVLGGFENFTDSGLPENTFIALGIHGQAIYVIQDYNMVIVKTGYDEDPLSSEWDHIQFLSLIKNSLN